MKCIFCTEFLYYFVLKILVCAIMSGFRKSGHICVYWPMCILDVPHAYGMYLICIWENSVSHISVGVPYEYTCKSMDVAMLNQVKCCTDYYNSIRIRSFIDIKLYNFFIAMHACMHLSFH